MHALLHSYFSHFISYSLVFLSFSIYPLCSSFAFCFSLISMLLAVLPCYFVFVYCAQLRPFYTTCRDEIYHFTPQLLFGLVWVFFLGHPLVCWLLSQHHYPTLAVLRSIPRQKELLICGNVLFWGMNLFT